MTGASFSATPPPSRRCSIACSTTRTCASAGRAAGEQSYEVTCTTDRFRFTGRSSWSNWPVLIRPRLSGFDLSPEAPSEAARRFSIAHELGHHVLDHFGDKPHAVCTDVAPKVTRHPNKRDFESEAQVFAANTLMPRFMVAKRCETAEPSLAIPQSIVADFKTSLPASTIRFVELSSEACAAVLSIKGAITWAVRSPTFTARIQRGAKVDSRTVAADFHASGSCSDRPRILPASAWISDDEDGDLVEHSMPVEEGGVISLVWSPKNGNR